ncbi:hypothetical protein JOF43_001147 [Brachybacterium sacelli]|uniref:Uncharacterized protein n=1 Tax=Brachybacterium sacelli TaxID=173364 RepID=A0ABS4WYB1_9MICO|nr:hypothetical protein [Brachybacterium sacelli]MBP2381190.1 hypothetical protein [Brachybacterium sacelli]
MELEVAATQHRVVPHLQLPVPLDQRFQSQHVPDGAVQRGVPGHLLLEQDAHVIDLHDGLPVDALRQFGMPMAPLLIGVILGPLAETELRRALAVSEGDPSILVSSPITLIVYVLLAGIVVVSVIQHLRHRRAARQAAAAG